MQFQISQRVARKLTRIPEAFALSIDSHYSTELPACPAPRTYSTICTLTPRLLQGGFLPEMTRREAALILGIREHAKEEVVKEAHRKVMIANHPDAGEQVWQYSSNSQGPVDQAVLM